MKMNRLGISAAAALVGLKNVRKRSTSIAMDGAHTPGIRAPGLAQREADAWNAMRPVKRKPTVGALMARAPKESRMRDSPFHHVKGNPPRAGWTYRAARRNKAKNDRGARRVDVGAKVARTSRL